MMVDWSGPKWVVELEKEDWKRMLEGLVEEEVFQKIKKVKVEQLVEEEGKRVTVYLKTEPQKKRGKEEKRK